MKNLRIVFSVIAICILTLVPGCNDIGNTSASISIIYALTTALSLILLIVCVMGVKSTKKWFILLFSSVFIVNVGYFWLSVAETLNSALMANRLAYLGSVFLPLSMLMIILNTAKVTYKKWIPIALIFLGLAVFIIAASPGFSDIYYKEVTLEVINGVSTLNKVYGPFHCTYLIYLLSYLTAMTAIIAVLTAKKKIESPRHSVILILAVTINLGVWFAEQLVSLNFEFLAISYIISEFFLLMIHSIIHENERLKALIEEKNKKATDNNSNTQAEPVEPEVKSTQEIDEQKELFLEGLPTLTQTESLIYEYYLQGKSTKEIMAILNIKENTLKFHNKNIYGKLGVSSRKQLIAIAKEIKK